jgi:hypothetical protein
MDYADYNYEKRIIGELKDIKSKLRFRGLSELVLVLAIVFIFVSWPSSFADQVTDKLWYSLKYDCDYKNVTVAKRPSGCDWLHAPIGAKGCHYKRIVARFAAEQRRQRVEQATSLDEKRQNEQMPNSVAISWEKESDD